MSTTVTPGIREFKPDNQEHVQWLKKLDGLLNEMMSAGPKGPTGSAGSSARMGYLMRNNPFGVTMPLEAFIDIHAGMSIRYSSHVMSGDAWIPPKESR